MAKKKAAKKTAKKVAKKVSKKASKKASKGATKKVAKKVAKKVSKKGSSKKVASKKATPAKKKVASKALKIKTIKPTLKDAKAMLMLKKWTSLQKKHGKTEPKSYNMREEYSERTPIQHKIHGWGFIISNTNDRLEVLFESGIKTLISNHKY